MAGWSSLAATRLVTTYSKCRNAALFSRLNIVPRTGLHHIQVRSCKSTGGTFNIVPSNFQWNKLKDIMHFYTMVGLIPALCIILYVNIFIGPATLKPIPEGYQPKPWEYHSHPITRFIAKYITKDPQKEYEKLCFTLFYSQEDKYAREVERKVKSLIADRRDFQSWYYSPAMTKYARRNAERVVEYQHTSTKYAAFPANE